MRRGRTDAVSLLEVQFLGIRFNCLLRQGLRLANCTSAVGKPRLGCGNGTPRAGSVTFTHGLPACHTLPFWLVTTGSPSSVHCHSLVWISPQTKPRQLPSKSHRICHSSTTPTAAVSTFRLNIGSIEVLRVVLCEQMSTAFHILSNSSFTNYRLTKPIRTKVPPEESATGTVGA
jgi:hypothetical protein